MIENNMMENKIIENNQAKAIGKVNSDISFSHEIYGEGFYKFILKVARLSDVVDFIPVTISERLLDNLNLQLGDHIEVNGQFRSYNNYNNYNNENKLLLILFAREIRLVAEDEKVTNPNYIYLNGYICKEPGYRTTPLGREICDILMAVNRSYNKSDYIPCITWGRNARYSSSLKVGENIKIWGRIQSREYQKKVSLTESITKTAYEVSISKMELGKEI